MHPDSQAFFTAFGKRLKELRKSKGWSVRDMVTMHGYHDAQWRHYENGKAVTIDSLLRMATVFNMSLMELLDGLGKFPKDPEPVKRRLRKDSASQPSSQLSAQ